MAQGPVLLVILLLAIVFIVLSTSKCKLHPFIALLIASYGVGFASGMNPMEISRIISSGFGGILSYIGLVILLGTIIGTILEKSGAAVTMADTILKAVGEKHPAVAMSVIGYIVSIPVFCDSGYVILSSLKKSIVNKTKTSSVKMSIALATGLYATHTLVPPTPGPIAAAGNLGLNDKLGMVILFGLIVSAFSAAAGLAWAAIAGRKLRSTEDDEPALDYSEIKHKYGKLPGPMKAFTPIVLPIILIAAGSVANYPGSPLGNGNMAKVITFLGQPLNALFIGFFFSLSLLPCFNKSTLTGWIEEGLNGAAIIIMITGAGGAFGSILKATPIGQYLGDTLSTFNMGLLLPFIIAAALKTSQGSSTVALVTTSALVAPLLATLGLDSEIGRILTVMAVGAGAMTVSHANDSFYWVVAEFSGMDVSTAYKSHTMATLVMGITTISVVVVLGIVLI